MTHAPYEADEALIYDPVAVNRNATRDMLRSLGFNKLEFASSLDALRDCLANRSPDLLLCEVGGREAEICALIQSIRQGKLGDNPFVVAILTTWRRDGTIVGQAVNSGADDLLARPVLAERFAERLKIHVEQRKDFVVTSSYIGPDRRRDTSRVGAQCVRVPNSLQMKTEPRLSTVEAERQIPAALREGKRIVDAEKLRRDAVQLYAQWRMLRQRNPEGRDFSAILARVGALASEIERRASGARSPSAADWCETLRETTQKIGASLPAAQGQAPLDIVAMLHEMGEAVFALGQIFAPADLEASRLIGLDATAAPADLRYHSNGRPSAAQSQLQVANRRATAA